MNTEILAPFADLAIQSLLLCYCLLLSFRSHKMRKDFENSQAMGMNLKSDLDLAQKAEYTVERTNED